jgi:FixJ family two-component response regulator
MGVCAPIYLVDDNPDICHFISAVVASVGYSVTSFGSAEEFLASGFDPQPHCLIVDLLLPGMTGLAFCRHAADCSPASGLIMISGQADIPAVIEAFGLGISDFLEKPFGKENLLASIHGAITEATARWQAIQNENELWSRIEALTCREREILNHMIAGLPTKTIARDLGISTRTVDVHRSRINQKLRLDSPGQLACLIAAVDRSPRATPLNRR